MFLAGTRRVLTNNNWRTSTCSTKRVRAVVRINTPRQYSTVGKISMTVIGVGGGGSNAVDTMISNEVPDVKFIAVNTDTQALHKSLAPHKVHLTVSQNSFRGAGTGADVEKGALAAEDSLADVEKELEGTDMLFIAAGMGGGTGTGAAPIIAQKAKDMGILTVGFITLPFKHEGPKRFATALSGIREMDSNTDITVVVSNQKLLQMSPNITANESYKMVDRVLYNGVKGIRDLLIYPGLINLDYADVENAIKDQGFALMAWANAKGENAAVEVTEAAINHPLLSDVSIEGAKSALISITGGSDVKMKVVNSISEAIYERVGPDCDILWGVSEPREGLEGAIEVLLIVTGMEAPPSFDEHHMIKRVPKKPKKPETNNIVTGIEEVKDEVVGNDQVETKEKDESVEVIGEDDVKEGVEQQNSNNEVVQEDTEVKKHILSQDDNNNKDTKEKTLGEKVTDAVNYLKQWW